MKNKKENRVKTVIITGSARGFGFEMAKVFKQHNFNIVLSDLKEENLRIAKKQIDRIVGIGKVATIVCDVTKYNAIQNLITQSVNLFGPVDIFINNAGVNQPNKAICELEKKEIDFLLDVDLKGTMFGSQLAFNQMQKQGFGQIYNVEGYGSNDAMMTGLSVYGTTKRAITYFTQALAKESKELTKSKIKICRIAPGIMITDFIKSANGGVTKIEIPVKIRKVYNILGDYAGKIAGFVVPRIIKNKKNNKKIVWLSNARAFFRFLTAGFRKNRFFKIK